SCDVIAGVLPALSGFSAMGDCCAGVPGEGVAPPFSWTSPASAPRLATSIAQTSNIPRFRLAGCIANPASTNLRPYSTLKHRTRCLFGYRRDRGHLREQTGLNTKIT